MEHDLFKWFGFTEFRESQKEIIENLLVKRDVFCVMATGHGKSICYQLPSLISGKISIVISPLLSIMQDQMINLGKKGIAACCFTPSLMYGDGLKADIVSGKYKIIYTTPETLIKDVNFFMELDPGLIAIDEAHCISLWGNSFRPSYIELSGLKAIFPQTPILALTGTATPMVESDIIRLLKLNDSLRVRTNPDRPNIKYFVHKKSDPLTNLLPLIQENVIIYCPTRNSTEVLEQLLRNHVSVRAYHAGISQSKRTIIHNEFLEGTVTCIIATICFGMGIDKNNIRKVIHYGSPRDIESYYQEIGRAGRDGIYSECHVFFTEADFARNRSFLKDITDQTIRKHREDMVTAIEKFLYLTTCRRKFVLSHFGSISSPNPNCCDNCSRPTDQIDIVIEVRQILGLLKDHSKMGGKLSYINVLRGAKTKKITDYIKQSSYFGIGKSRTIDWWKICIQHLNNEGLIEQKLLPGGYGYVINIGLTGLCWLQTNRSYMINNNIFVNLSAPQKSINQPPQLPSTNQTPISLRLINQTPISLPLINQTHQLLVLNRPIQMINNTLPIVNPVIQLPMVNQEIQLPIVNRPIQMINNTLPMVNQVVQLPMVNQVIQLPMVNHRVLMINNLTQQLIVDKSVESKLTKTVFVTYNLFQGEKKELKDIASIRNLKPATIETHIADCLRAGIEIDFHRLPLTMKDYDEIMTEIETLNGDISKLAQLKAACPSNIQYYQIKCALAIKEANTRSKLSEN